MPLAALHLLGLALAAALSTPVPPHHACIDTASHPSWIAVDDHTILVRDGSTAFKVTTATCPALTDALPQFTTVLPGGSLICDAHDAHLYVGHDNLIPAPCQMQAVEPITRDEAQALSYPSKR